MLFFRRAICGGRIAIRSRSLLLGRVPGGICAGAQLAHGASRHTIHGSLQCPVFAGAEFAGAQRVSGGWTIATGSFAGISHW